MAGNSKNDLVSSLRSKLSDDRASTAAFSIAVTATAKSALLEISNGFLTVTIESGQSVDSLRFNLNEPRYSTIGRLFSQLTKSRGYQVTADTHMHSDHLSIDLRVDGMQEIAEKKSYTLRHHIWSEQELASFVQEAMFLHNPNYVNLSAVPKNEHPFVIMKAQAAAYRALAADSARRKGLETDAETLLSLAQDLERQYRDDRQRLARVVPVPKADESKMGTGDTVVGSLVRRSLRAGYTAPHRPAGNTQPPHLYDTADDDVEDVIARIRWSQAREARFVYYELWRDTQPKVERNLSGKLDAVGATVPVLAAQTQYAKAGTSKQVMGIHTAINLTSPVFDGFFFWTAAEMAGANVTMATFVDGLIMNTAGQMALLGDPLEPDTEYYYRLYATDWNGEILPSEVKKIRTKAMRMSFLRNANQELASDAINPIQGPIAGGTAITIKGQNFGPGLKVTVGGKDCAVTVDNASQLTVTSPTFANPQFAGRFVDIVIQSPNGLRDIAVRGWKLTA